MQVSVGAAKKSAAKAHEINLIRPTASFAKKGGKDEQSASCPPPLSVASIRGAFRPVTGLTGSGLALRPRLRRADENPSRDS